MGKPIVQIAVGQTRVGEVERPQLYALTLGGDVHQYVLPAKGGEEARWEKLPPIEEDGE